MNSVRFITVCAVLVLCCSPAATTEPPVLEPAAAGFPVSDEFELLVDPSWSPMNLELVDAEMSDGQLVLTPNQFSVWFHADRGPAYLQEVSGDFHMTTAVTARSASNPSQAVSNYFQFAGIIVRDPSSDTDAPENYVFSVVGYRGDYLSHETKNTVDDLSMVDGPPWSSGDAELRICRVGSAIKLFIRDVGADVWIPGIEYTRNDFPETVQVGPIAYAYTDDVDLRASFDYVRFARVEQASDCTAD
ncbi:MAG: hypothetical protein ACJAYU_000584 [Bradymonadia bacterium]|jgi:hypothetical protein